MMEMHNDSILRIRSAVLGGVGTNCYFVYNDRTKEAVVIDPADNEPYIADQCGAWGIMPKAILLTHGHADHMLAAEGLRKRYGIPLIAGEKEEKLLADPSMNLSPMIGGCRTILKADRLVKENDILELIGFHFQVIETPGHTEGSVCYWIKEEEVLFAGDTLFEESFGRTDFPTGSMSSLCRSIVDKLFVLPDATMVYSGHGAATTIGHEKEYNPIYHYRRDI